MDPTTTAVDDLPADVVIAAFAPGGLTSWQAWAATGTEIAEWFTAEFTAVQAAWWVALRPDESAAAVARLLGEHPDATLADWWHFAMSWDLPFARAVDWMEVFNRFGYKTAGVWAHDPDCDPDRAAELIEAGWAHPAEHAHWSAINPTDPMAALVDGWAPVLAHTIYADRDRPVINGVVDDTPPSLYSISFESRCQGLWQPTVFLEWQVAAFGKALPVADIKGFEDLAAGAHAAGFGAAEFIDWVDGLGTPSSFPRGIEHDNLIGAAVLWRDMFGDLASNPDRLRLWSEAWPAGLGPPGFGEPSAWVEYQYPPAVAHSWMAVSHAPTRSGAWSMVGGVDWHQFGFDPADPVTADWVSAVADMDQDQAVVHTVIIPIAALMYRRGLPPEAWRLTEILAWTTPTFYR